MFGVSVLVLLVDHLPLCKMQPDRGAAVPRFGRSEERRGGKEWRSWVAPVH